MSYIFFSKGATGFSAVGGDLMAKVEGAAMPNA